MKTIVTAIPDYKTFNQGNMTLDIGYPWLTFGAIMALEKILRDSRGRFTILELGSGGSTLFFEEKCKKLIALEHDRRWTVMVREKLKTNHATVLWRRSRKFVKIIESYPDETFDLILVDSYSGGATYKHRQEMLDVSGTKVKRGGWLVIDNYERLKFDYTNYDVYTFDMLRYSGRGTKLCKRL